MLAAALGGLVAWALAWPLARAYQRYRRTRADLRWVVAMWRELMWRLWDDVVVMVQVGLVVAAVVVLVAVGAWQALVR